MPFQRQRRLVNRFILSP